MPKAATDSQEKDGGEALRKSDGVTERTRKGKRSTPAQDENNSSTSKETPEGDDDDALSTTSHYDVKIAKGHLDIALKIQEKLERKDELSQAHFAKALEIAEMEIKLNTKQDELEAIADKENMEASKSFLDLTISKLKRDIAAMTKIHKINEGIFDSLTKRIDGEIEILNCRREYARTHVRVQQETAENLVGVIDNDDDGKGDVAKWVAEADAKKLEEERNRKAQELLEEEQRQLQQVMETFRLQREQAGITTVTGSGNLAIPKVSRIKVEAIPQESGMGAGAIPQGHGFGAANPTSTMGGVGAVPFYPMNTQFLARQSHGKELPIFSGKPEEWLRFKGAYDRTNSICGFREDEILNRLENCLRDDALKLVSAMMTNPAHVPQIMAKLEMRFGQPDSIIKSVMDKLRNTPTLNPNQLESIVEFGCAVDNLTYTLLALGRKECLNNSILIEEMESKLSVAWRMEWRGWLDAGKKPRDLESFSLWMETKTMIASALCPPKLSSQQDRRRDQRDGRNRNKWLGEKVFVTGEAEKTKSGCACCNLTNHTIHQCFKFKKMPVKERRLIVKQKRLCYICLNSGHGVTDCRNKTYCGHEGCTDKHHRLIHEGKKSQPAPERVKEPEKPEERALASIDIIAKASAKCRCKKKRTIYKMVEATLLGPNDEEVEGFLIKDDCSAFTILDNEVTNELHLKRKRKPFRFGGLGYNGNRPNSDVVELRIRSHYNNEVYTLKNVQTDDVNYLPCRSLAEDDLAQWEHLKDIPLKFYDNAVPKLLLGIEHADIMETIRRTDGKGGGPIACETKLGWVVTGTLPETIECPKNESVLMLNDDEDDNLHQLVKDHFATEDFGVKVVEDKPRSAADRRAVEIMESTARKVDGKWEMGLLWKEDNVELPESKSMAYKRMKSTEKKMDRDSSFAKDFVKKIEEYNTKGYIRKLTPEEISVEHPRVWYLPIFGVTNPNKPGKFRPVLDCAATSHGVSLNDRLLTGPDFVPPLTSVLFRFRERAIAFTGDISEMFHQVKIKEEDQFAQRFLWRGIDRDREPDEYAMQVMVFGAACSPSCAQYIKNRNADEVGADYPEAVSDIKKNHYVDDYLASTDTVEEALERQRQIQEIHSKGGFTICKWISNSMEFNSRIPEELRAEGTKNMEMNSMSFSERVLGMHWEPNSDLFTFKTDFFKVDKDIVLGRRIPTKREALGLTMSIYDQFGFLAHFTIKSKMILQKAWRSKVGWDDELPPPVHESWINWTEELAGITTLKVPRCYSLNLFKAESVQLHIFSDGSEDAFSAMGYFRVQSGEGVEVALVSAKAKVAPLKPISIPRMELQGAVMGTRIAKTIEEEHRVKITERIYWCDSSTVLKWIKADGRNFKTFVGHRIGEIQEATEVSEWRWIPTAENVADEATRHNKPCDWSSTSRWLNGPKFLKLPRSEWPTEREKPDENISLEDFELKKEFLGMTMESKSKCLLEIKNFSSWVKLIRITARIMIAVVNFRKKRGEVKLTRLTAIQMENADRLWWKWSQKEAYPEEYQALKRDGVLKSNSPLINLCPFLDDHGVMRMKGRIPSNAEIFTLERNPVILHPKHPYTVLLIKLYHQRAEHHGMERVVNDLRQRFCIPTLRVAVKRAWNNCQLCKNRRAMPKPPIMGDLPLARLESFVHPFTITGLDYFGPMDVTVGYKRREKRYGALFTCMSTRAIHVEMAASLSTDSCLMAIRRFISRRGNPRDLFSDNGTNFVGANNEIKRALSDMDQDKVTSEMANRGINWHFITPAAPHMGGAWERKVKSFKVAMAATLKERAPREEVLLTLMAEAENTVNGHPLTHVPCDPEDLEALTPNHFLIGRSNNLLSWRKEDDKEKCIRRLWEQAQQLADLFWRRWVQEYLPTLTKRDKWFQNQKPIQVGDVVILVDNTQPRNCWPKGRIVEVYPGKDGQVRTVLVKTASGTYKRPAVKICVLDVKGDTEEEAIVSKPEDEAEAVLILSEVCSKKMKTST